MTCLSVMGSLSLLCSLLLAAGDTETVLPPRPTITGRSPTDAFTRPSKLVNCLAAPSQTVVSYIAFVFWVTVYKPAATPNCFKTAWNQWNKCCYVCFWAICRREMYNWLTSGNLEKTVIVQYRVPNSCSMHFSHAVTVRTFCIKSTQFLLTCYVSIVFARWHNCAPSCKY